MKRFDDAPAARRQAHLVQELSRAVQRSLLDALLRLGDEPGTPRAPMTAPRARVPSAPARLARHQPGGAAARAGAQSLYERCLAQARAEAAADAAPAGHDDVGAVLARFVAANVGALRDDAVTAPMLRRLARQLAAIVQQAPAWRRAELQERQSYVEELAVIGVLVREMAAQAALQGAAATDHVRSAARGYLRQLLGLEPDRLAIGEHGLAMVEALDAPEPSAA